MALAVLQGQQARLRQPKAEMLLQITRRSYLERICHISVFRRLTDDKDACMLRTGA
jgi:hypothetical protein